MSSLCAMMVIPYDVCRRDWRVLGMGRNHGVGRTQAAQEEEVSISVNMGVEEGTNKQGEFLEGNLEFVEVDDDIEVDVSFFVSAAGLCLRCIR